MEMKDHLSGFVQIVRPTMRKMLVALFGLGFIVISSQLRADEALQVLVSATPVPISLPSPLPFVTEASLSTVTPTRTPTPNGPVLLEALSEANVRAEPDTGAEKLGTIRSGDVYPVLGKYYRWYKFQYNTSPSGFGWVFDELVNIIGDESLIPDLTQDALPTLDPALAGATGTMNAITQTPGGILTVTANAAIIQLPVESGGNASSINLPQENAVLPTFTFPADVFLPTLAATDALGVAAQPTDSNVDTGLSLPASFPPIAPILILAGLGIVGLFLSSYRR